MNGRRIVREGLDILKPYLRAFAEQQLRKAYGSDLPLREPRLGENKKPDVQALFGVYLEHWRIAFSGVLQAKDRSLIFELKEARNDWAHERSISLDQAYRALDSIEILLGSLGASAEIARIAELKRQVRIAQVGSAYNSRGASRRRDTTGWQAGPQTLGSKGAELRGKTLRIAPRILKEGNPRRPFTHGWLAFEVLRRAEGGTLSFEDYGRRLFSPDAEIRELAKGIPGVPNAYQDLKHIRHDIAHGRVYVEE